MDPIKGGSGPNDSQDLIVLFGRGFAFSCDLADVAQFVRERREQLAAETGRRPDNAILTWCQTTNSDGVRSIKKFGECIIIDGHSFSSNPLPHEINRSKHRPQICIGTDEFHTPNALTDLSVRFFKKKGFSVGVNEPFAGSLVPIKYFKKNKRVRSIMIVINRKLYMNEITGLKLTAFKRIKVLIDDYIKEVAIQRGRFKST